MKDLDFSWREKGELKPSFTENPHKICRILKLKVVQCRGSHAEQTGSGRASWSCAEATASSSNAGLGMGCRELTLKTEMLWARLANK